MMTTARNACAYMYIHMCRLYMRVYACVHMRIGSSMEDGKKRGNVSSRVCWNNRMVCICEREKLSFFSMSLIALRAWVFSR